MTPAYGRVVADADRRTHFFYDTMNKEIKMKRYQMKGPDGSWWVTTASSLAKARANFAYRLKKAGLFMADAYAWASGTKEVAS